MNKKAVSVIMLTVLWIGLLIFAFNIQSGKADPETIYVDDNNSTGPWNGTPQHPYKNITSALQHAAVNDTIYVYNGIYKENVVINSKLMLVGESSDATIIDGDGEYAVSITSDNATITNFTIQNIGHLYTVELRAKYVNLTGNRIDGVVYISNAPQSRLVNNTIIGGTAGIRVFMSKGSVFRNNTIKGSSKSLFFIRALFSIDEFTLDIDSSNTVDGEPIWYLTNRKGLVINPKTFPNIGYLGIVNSTNIIVQDISMANNGQGLLLAGTTSSKIENVTVSGNDQGIGLYWSDQNTISKNIVERNEDHGIYIYESSINTLAENNVTKNQRYSDGILLDDSSYNSVYENNIADNENVGLHLKGSTHNKLRNNTMVNNKFNMEISDIEPSTYENDIDTSNTVDGKPVYHWVSKQDMSVPSDAGYVALIRCKKITVKNLNLRNNRPGILLASTENSTITQNNATDNAKGILLYSSSENNIFRNTIVSNSIGGISLFPDSTRNVISENNIINSGSGVDLWLAKDNVISENVIKDNWYGVYINNAFNNTFIDNNFLDNRGAVEIVAYGWKWSTANFWDDGYPSGGNFWSDYQGEDFYKGSFQNETGSDGIGDTPYVIDEDNQDNYPLMIPWGEKEPPVADAGADQTIDVGATVTFDGSKSTDDVAIKSYVWTFTDVIPKALSGMHPTYTFNNVGDFEVTLEVSDYVDNKDTNTIRVHVLPDRIPPLITILSPENTTYTTNNVPLAFTADEATSWIGYSLDGQTNVTITGDTTLFGLADGSHSLIVYVKDITGNTGASEFIYFSVKTQKPEDALQNASESIIVVIIVVVVIGGTTGFVIYRKRKASVKPSSPSTI